MLMLIFHHVTEKKTETGKHNLQTKQKQNQSTLHVFFGVTPRSPEKESSRNVQLKMHLTEEQKGDRPCRKSVIHLTLSFRSSPLSIRHDLCKVTPGSHLCPALLTANRVSWLPTAGLLIQSPLNLPFLLYLKSFTELPLGSQSCPKCPCSKVSTLTFLPDFGHSPVLPAITPTLPHTVLFPLFLL